MDRRFALPALLFTHAMLACDAPEPAEHTRELDPDSARRLASASVFFGHQSVGEDILEGVEDRLGRKPGGWREAWIGVNQDPIGKLADFEQAMSEGAGAHAELALMKFCYVDFQADTDEVALFQRYRQTLARLAQARPQTTFIHVTAPLTTVRSGPKAWLKRGLGLPVWGERENLKRARYNELIRAEYGGKAPLFDLAAIEVGPLEARDAQATPMLAPEYTDDGGHLNRAGRQRAAEGLLDVLLPLVEACSS